MAGKNVPLTIAAYDREAGTVTIIFQIVGATTEKLNHKEQGEYIQDFVGLEQVGDQGLFAVGAVIGTDDKVGAGGLELLLEDNEILVTEALDFDESMARGAMYRDFELHAREETCNLFKQEVK